MGKLNYLVIDGHGNESIYQTRNVYAKTEKSENTRRVKSVFFQTEDKSEIEIFGSDYTLIYVMNDNGKTVADYILGADKPIVES